MTANSSHPKEIAQLILNAINSSSRNIRYPVGRDVESVLKARTEMSDIDLTVGTGKLSGEKRFHTTVILHTRQIKKS